jgi:hypothetical protein
MGQWNHSHRQWIETQERRKPKYPKDENKCIDGQKPKKNPI